MEVRRSSRNRGPAPDYTDVADFYSKPTRSSTTEPEPEEVFEGPVKYEAAKVSVSLVGRGDVSTDHVCVINTMLYDNNNRLFPSQLLVQVGE